MFTFLLLYLLSGLTRKHHLCLRIELHSNCPISTSGIDSEHCSSKWPWREALDTFLLDSKDATTSDAYGPIVMGVESYGGG